MSESISPPSTPLPPPICRHCLRRDKITCMLNFVLNIPYLPASYHWPAVTDSSTLLWTMACDPRSERCCDAAHIMTGVQLIRGVPLLMAYLIKNQKTPNMKKEAKNSLNSSSCCSNKINNNNNSHIWHCTHTA